MLTYYYGNIVSRTRCACINRLVDGSFSISQDIHMSYKGLGMRGLGQFIKDKDAPLRWIEAYTPLYSLDGKTPVPEHNGYYVLERANDRASDLITQYGLNASIMSVTPFEAGTNRWLIVVDFDSEADEAVFIMKVLSTSEGKVQ